MYKTCDLSKGKPHDTDTPDINGGSQKTPIHMLIPHIYAVLYDTSPFEVYELPREKWTPNKELICEYLSEIRKKKTERVTLECSMDVASIENLIRQNPNFIGHSELKAARDIALSIVLDELENAISACQESIDFYIADKWFSMVEQCNDKMRKLTEEYGNIKQMLEEEI